MKNEQRRLRPGFTLIESLISLSLFTIITLACLEFFSHTRVLFNKLKEKFQTTESIFFALDRIRFDLHIGGQGLLNPISLGILEPFDLENDHCLIFIREKIIQLENDLVSGQTYIQLKNTMDLKKDRILCIFNPQLGEIKKIAEIDSAGISLSSQLENSYQLDTTTVLLIRTISFYVDEKSLILRRKINNSPAQPLLEDVRDFECFFNQENKLIYIRIHMNKEEDKFHEIIFIPKNSALAANLQNSLPSS